MRRVKCADKHHDRQIDTHTDTHGHTRTHTDTHRQTTETTAGGRTDSDCVCCDLCVVPAIAAVVHGDARVSVVVVAEDGTELSAVRSQLQMAGG